MWNTIVRRGAAYLLVAVLAGCGGGDPDPDQSPGPATEQPGASPSSPATEPPAAQLIEVGVVDGQVEPALDRVEVDQGEQVRIVVSSDVPDEVHLHGYDLEAAVTPDEDAVIEFVADQTGLFELETHEQGLVLLQLQVQ